ncbi:LysR substrate-binding domain-containing protein, partial [Klebsiella pneumoniae]
MCQLGAFLVSEEIKKGRLVPVLTEFSLPESPICALYPTKRYLPPKVREFLALIADRLVCGEIWICLVLSLS